MSTLGQTILDQFKNKEFAHSFMEELVNTYLATQIKILRNQRDWTQAKLADEAEMHQERISILENVNYSSWSLSTLRDIGRAFDLVPFVSFEKFSSILPALDNLYPESLERLSRMDDLFPDIKWLRTESTEGTSSAEPQSFPKVHLEAASPLPQWADEGAHV